MVGNRLDTFLGLHTGKQGWTFGCWTSEGMEDRRKVENLTKNENYQNILQLLMYHVSGTRSGTKGVK